MTYLRQCRRYAEQFSPWSPVRWYVHDDFGNLIEINRRKYP